MTVAERKYGRTTDATVCLGASLTALCISVIMTACTGVIVAPHMTPQPVPPVSPLDPQPSLSIITSQNLMVASPPFYFPVNQTVEAYTKRDSPLAQAYGELALINNCRGNLLQHHQKCPLLGKYHFN